MELGKVRPCCKVACYNQRNGRECYKVRHIDGDISYEWSSRTDAEIAARTPYREATANENWHHKYSTC